MNTLFILCLVSLGTCALSSYPRFPFPTYEPNTGSPVPCVPPPYVIDVYNVTSSVKKRFACTRVHSEIVNTGNVSQEVCFSIQMPAEAFVSGLCLEVGGKKFSGVVREKAAARETHEENVRTGVTSGLIESRGMDQFRVCLSAGPEERALFSVEYQQLLVMRLGTVSHSVNIQPTGPVNRIYGKIEVEDRAEQGSVTVSEGKLTTTDELITCEIFPTPVEPPVECEKGVSLDFGTSYRPVPVDSGVGTGSSSGEYFVQFFSPTSDLDCICQNFIFVIDKSGSMSGSKIRQAKQAAEFLLDSLRDSDFFNIVVFDSVVNSFRPALVSVREHRQDGIDFVKLIQAYGGTNINSALIQAISQLCSFTSGCVSQITLLSDGQATVGETNPVTIANSIRTRCPDTSRSINCLAFGSGADSALLKTISYGNGGRYQFIYEGTDAGEQLSGFLETVLCPLLSNINFVFPGQNVVNLSVSSFPAYYRGDELVVSGQMLSRDNVSFEVTADMAGGGVFRYSGLIETVVGEEDEQVCLEGQLHAFQLIKQGLEQISAAETREEKEVLRGQILEYALQFRFVTDLTSLIVSPLVSEGCECPSSCSCSPSACVVDSSDKTDDGIKINPETEYGDRDGDGGGAYDTRRLGAVGAGGTLAYLALTNLGTRTTTTPTTTTTTTTPATTTTTTPATTTTTPTPSACGVWRDLSVCVRGTKNYFQVRCGSCPGLSTRELPCGNHFRGQCFLTMESGTPVCKLRREMRRMGRKTGRLPTCEDISYPQTLDGVSCRYKNGACALQR